MEMGTGKSRTVLEIAKEKLNAKKAMRVIWICPVAAQETIKFEIMKHTDCSEDKIHIFNKKTRAERMTNALFYIVGSESIGASTRVWEALESLSGDSILILDESDLFRNGLAKRTKRMTSIAWKFKYRYLLSGTPISKGIEDLYTQFAILDRRILGYQSWPEFARFHLEYTDTQPRRIAARHNTGLLQKKIEPYVYQVTRKECMTLPPKTYTSRYLDMPAHMRKLYNETKEKILLEGDAFQWGDATIYKLFTALQQITSGFLNVEDKTIRLFENPSENLKIQVLLDALSEMQENTKAVVWTKYRNECSDIQAALSEAGYRCYVIHGDVGLEERQNILDSYRKDEGGAVLVIMIGIGGRAIDLTCATFSIYFADTFNISQRLQSEDRLHRLGQTKNVLYLDVGYRASIDEKIHNCREKRTSFIQEFKRNIAAIQTLPDEEREAKMKELLTNI